MKYYLAIGNQQAGPFEVRELVEKGLTAETLVWYQGAPNWVKASMVAELQPLLASLPAAPQPQSQPVPQPEPQPQVEVSQATQVQQPVSQPQFDAQPVSQPQFDEAATQLQQPVSQPQFDAQPVSQPQYGDPMATQIQQPAAVSQPQYGDPYSQPQYPQQPQAPQYQQPYGDPYSQPQYPQPYGTPQYPQPYGAQPGMQPYGAPSYGFSSEPIPPRPNNNMVWAILCTLFCCLPLGVAAIVQASGVNSAYDRGDYAGAQAKANQAKNTCIASAILGLIASVIYIIALMNS